MKQNRRGVRGAPHATAGAVQAGAGATRDQLYISLVHRATTSYAGIMHSLFELTDPFQTYKLLLYFYGSLVQAARVLVKHTHLL